MGIQDLPKYVDTLPCGKHGVWEFDKLRDTNLIVDGRGLCYYIHSSNRLDMKYGGQYQQLQDKVREFVAKLRSNNVVPYVVFDGIMTKDEKKFDTKLKRKQKCLKRMKAMWSSRSSTNDVVIPCLAQIAFVQVLQELDVKYAVADLNTTVKKFKFQNFAKHLGIDPGMLPLFASLIGNDYVSEDVLEQFMVYLQQPTDKIPAIAKFLSKYKSNDASTVFKDVVELIPSVHPKFEETLRLSVEEYKTKESNLIGYFNSNDLSCNILTFNDHSLPQWAVELFRVDSVAPSGFACLCNRKVFLRPQCEDTSKPSAQVCVQDLRWYYYAMLQHFEKAAIGRELRQPQSEAGAQSLEITVTEFDRKESEYPKEGTWKFNLTQIISQIDVQIEGIRKMSDDDKKSHLLKLLIKDSDLPFIHNLAIGHQLVVAALRYWIIHCDVNQKQLAAILVHYVGEKPRPIKPNKSLQDVLIRTVHGFSQWQNVVYWTEKLNSLFSAPFQHLQAAKLYNGKQVCLVHKRLISEEGVKAESMVIYPNLYRLLHNAITKDIRDDWQLKPAKDEKKTTSKDYLKGNRFAVLGESDSD
ncbi:protein asteroid homolog 1-like [Dendronephthya gigantea]|uniref:protein asteroid homolog 1-like n=1 Tax=Dendronephthya gigantea TaxID=151771 RepID=UPI00106B97B7|nr:protein asteroid homolog 1-like [Dendronephthya gigantea]